MKFHVGTDVGGTFTDLWLLASDGRTGVFKSSTTSDIITGILDALGLAAEAFDMSMTEFCASIERFGHGSTVGLNALLTGKTAKTAIITTAGFADTLEIARMRRQVAGLNELEVSDYFLRGQWPPLVPRSLIYEVSERIDRRGQIIQPLNENGVRAIVRKIAAECVEAVAICTLWATQNPVHEQRLQALVQQEMPGAFVSVSHKVSPTVGEYARMSTTAANAALGPVVSRYLERLGGALSASGLPVDILAMTSAGGVVAADSLAELPVAALFSGPAACVIGSQELAQKMSRDKVLTIDVGGTSFDVGASVDGKPLMRSEISLAGADIRFPSIDVSSIGAGGGSIASVQHGTLVVGPQSAGANPGPACYGRGGTKATATDADLVLGVLDARNFAGGRMKLDVEAATKAIADTVATPLGLSVMEAAWGIREVLDSRMGDLLRRVTIERGYDPRDFALFANGGSGPSHAWTLCRDLGIESFIVPATATGQSAYGTGTSDLRHTAEKSVYLRFSPKALPREEQLQELREALYTVSNAVLEDLRREGASDSEHVEHTLSMRYRGQAHHLDVSLSQDDVTETGFPTCLDRFEREYEALFGRGAAFREAGFEVLSVRALGIGRLSLPVMPSGKDALIPIGSRFIVFDDPLQPVEATVYSTEYPASGQSVEGPCVIEFPGQTVVVPPGGNVRSDELGNLHVKLNDAGREIRKSTVKAAFSQV
jgi:N-methylhydantoinase A